MKKLLFMALVLSALLSSAQDTQFIERNRINLYVDQFNANDEESIINLVDNQNSWEWIQQNVPFFECPDKEMEEIYYYRWWIYRKHIKKTPSGYVITEFLPEVRHAAKYNTIACASGLHVDEGKWLRNPKYIYDYLRFWFSPEGTPRQYSTWLVTSLYEYCVNTGDFSLAEETFPKLVENYLAWEKSNLHRSGLYWSYDDRDGGEHSISGSGLRPTLNSFMYADAISIAKLATRLGDKKTESEFTSKAQELKQLFHKRLWDPEDKFFCSLPLEKKEDKIATFNHREVDPDRHVRELYGYFPWKFMLAEKGYEAAWNQIMDKTGFYAPFGPTTAEQRHPLFMKNRIKRCQWDGSSWPFATSIALGGMRNLLNHYDQNIVGKEDFFTLMKNYTRSQHRTLPYGDIIPWIGESLHPHSGIWLSRAIALDMKIPLASIRGFKDKNAAVLRGKDYNHSSYCDLIISGLVGLNIVENSIILNPLVPKKEWEWFCLEGIQYKGKTITIIYDKKGSKYKLKPGLILLVNGKEVAYSKKLEPLTISLSQL